MRVLFSDKRVPIAALVLALLTAVPWAARQLRVGPLGEIKTIADLKSPTVRWSGADQTVTLAGVSTYQDFEGFLLDDGDTSVWVDAPRQRWSTAFGLHLEVTATVEWHANKPILKAQSIRELGPKRPRAHPASLEQITKGKWDDRLVAFRARAGIAAPWSDTKVAIEVSDGRNKGLIAVEDMTQQQAEQLTGREINIEGVVRNRYSATGQLLQAVVHLPQQEEGSDLLRPRTRHSPLTTLPTLTKIAQLDQLPAIGTPAHPVRFIANVTYYARQNYLLFINDGTAGAYVMVRPDLPANLAAGQQIEVTGHAASGRFAPLVERPKVRILGPASPLQAVTLPPDQTASPHLDSELVEGSMHVRDVSRVDGAVLLSGIAGRHDLRLHLQWPNNEPIPPELTDSKVRFRGVYGVLSNVARQIVGAHVWLASRADLVVMERGVQLSMLPIKSVRSVVQYSSSAPDRRLRVAGTVAAMDGDLVYLEDDSGGIAVQLAQSANLTIGDHVTVAGYLAIENSLPMIQSAVAQKDGTGKVAPWMLVEEDIVDGRCQSQLVRLQAHVVETSTRGWGGTWVLQAGRRLVSARLPISPNNDLPVLAQHGDFVEVTGVCTTELDVYRDVHAIKKFELILRTPSDVRVLQKRSWWTLQRTVILLLIVTSAALLAIGWIASLRRRVQEQTSTIRSQLAREEALKRAAETASSAKSEFLANMSHEIRTPLNGMLGMADVALESSSPEEQRECLKLVKQCGRSLLSIINDILDISKIEAGKLHLDPHRFRLDELMQAVAALFAGSIHAKGLALDWDVDPSTTLEVVGDDARLRQVLVNLIGNAIKFTDAGTIRVSVSRHSLDSESALIHFSVQDSGIGIPSNKLDSIFNAFEQADNSVTRRYGGTGLGLAISRKLVEMMGGVLRVESVPGQGSTFSFTVKLGLATPDDRPASAEPARKDASGDRPLRILLAEDNLVNQRVAQSLLQKRGHQVVTVANGAEAVDAVGRERFDVVLMDVQMPVLDGLSATRRIRELQTDERARVPIIALTAHALKEDRDICLNAGMDGYVPKPIQPESLLSLIAAVCSNGASEPAEAEGRAERCDADRANAVVAGCEWIQRA